MDNDIVPDPYDAPSYDGLNEQLLQQREGVKHERDLLNATKIINDHAPVQPLRYLPKVKCATPTCNFHGTYWEHSEHVAKLVLRELGK